MRVEELLHGVCVFLTERGLCLAADRVTFTHTRKVNIFAPFSLKYIGRCQNRRHSNTGCRRIVCSQKQKLISVNRISL